MSAVLPGILTESRIRLTKVTRRADRHEVRELTIEIELEGDFAGSYNGGDNRLVIATDTMKNVAYALAKTTCLESIEDSARRGKPLLANHSHVEPATVRLAEQPLERSPRRPRPSSRISGKTIERRTSTVTRWRRRHAESSRASTAVPPQGDGFGLLGVPARSVHNLA